MIRRCSRHNGGHHKLHDECSLKLFLDNFSVFEGYETFISCIMNCLLFTYLKTKLQETFLVCLSFIYVLVFIFY